MSITRDPLVRAMTAELQDVDIAEDMRTVLAIRMAKAIRKELGIQRYNLTQLTEFWNSLEGHDRTVVSEYYRAKIWDVIQAYDTLLTTTELL